MASLPPPINPKNFEQYVDDPLVVLSSAVAEQGGVVRVVERDGEPLVVTLDFVPTRLNVAVVGADERVIRIISSG